MSKKKKKKDKDKVLYKVFSPEAEELQEFVSMFIILNKIDLLEALEALSIFIFYNYKMNFPSSDDDKMKKRFLDVFDQIMNEDDLRATLQGEYEENVKST